MTMITTTMATMITPNVKCKEPSMIYPLLRLAVQHERQTLDAGDARAAAGRDLRGPAVNRTPGTAAVLHTAGIPRRQRDDHRDRLAGRTGAERGQPAAHALVDTAAKPQHESNREDREYQPLQPGGHVHPGQMQTADQQRRGADEHQIELRVDECQFRAKKYAADGDPCPPMHDRYSRKFLPSASSRRRSPRSSSYPSSCRARIQSRRVRPSDAAACAKSTSWKARPDR